MKIHSLLFAALCLFLLATPVEAKNDKKLNKHFVAYVEKYSDLAVKHMDKYNIPASIKLAQGLLESGGGQSEAARVHNNHFGIKCHSGWKGARFYRADDGPNDCFRSYRSADQSYDDHSLFLSERERYNSLFKLNIMDYKAWAKGLYSCGYATDRHYANKVIKLIEDYELYQYDRQSKHYKRKGGSAKENIKLTRDIFKRQGLVYLEAEEGDDLNRIASDIGFKVKDLAKFNEVPVDFPLYAGDIVYLQKKKSKADKPNYEHIVQVGESMHSISQLYGMRALRLYKLNKKSPDYIPEPGDVLRLR